MQEKFHNFVCGGGEGVAERKDLKAVDLLQKELALYLKVQVVPYGSMSTSLAPLAEVLGPVSDSS